MLQASRFVLLLLLINASSLAADSAEQQLTALLSASNTLQANFLQYTLDSSGANIQEIKGKIWLQRPHLFRWHAEPPFEQIIVADGELLWFYDPDLEQVIVQKYSADMAKTPVVLLSGAVESLASSFDVHAYADERGSHFVLEPLAGDSLFEVLTLSFQDERISEISIEDSLDQKTRIQFQDSVFNQPIDAQHFRFTVPAGVDVIRDY
ncbi:MAG: outer membrane lipoprotein chaperone LolA [Pseudomonadales bacterium]|jgi:outer membrane lipoprotein carrier protein|nr:outer membrane lipoprotein chaperone LolA [Pseudomonadales bacterium]MDP7146483.1 outer membrane lipoprotein chaperone LolA [Pseudomonadales bacterium]MDP7358303.1 outer membrane lipoprotein chaperone LolA [Pseudomonadales bacterium]MDP7597784.1 outer membrane lipoprotein chaperone LolA [Pseudomonadales bacterium]HJN52329.1 outer membrane lipoprotein chaperone LolA [Pseudomonadales bacterium]|tara:strand:+ start:3748 stop:4371 length:624 start_codon:yes stop_codon:yes gene_type:complete